MRWTVNYVGAVDLEKLTGTKASTWRYWASIGTGPASFKLGRRRVWKKSDVVAWLAQQQDGVQVMAHNPPPQKGATRSTPRRWRSRD